MAVTAVESLLENVKRLLINHTNLTKEARIPIEKLHTSLRHFRAFLEDTTKMQKTDKGLLESVRQIRDVVFEAEDAIDIFETELAIVSKSKRRLFRPSKNPQMLLQIAERVENVSDSIRDKCVHKSFLSLDSNTARDEDKEMPSVTDEEVVVMDEEVVGVEEDTRVLIKYLTEETEELDIITIVGMPGLGKTTLARKIFCDATIEYEFSIRIWVRVSAKFRMRDVLLTILKDLTQLSDNVYGKSEPELAQQVASYLEKEKFLIVMDDVWTTDDWNKLQLALPKSNPKGKVLITSCREDMGRFANRSRVPHRLRFLTMEESLIMLQLKVFGKLDVDPKELGMLIGKLCGGLPLALAVIGDIIIKLWSKGTAIREDDYWRRKCETVHIHVNGKFYHELPNHLKACFLYFGMFPKDYEIPASKLMCMWIAEGFVQKQGLSSEEAAEYYLKDLICRSLVTVAERKADGGIKTCRIHGTLHDFCRFEAGKERENIFQEIRKSRVGFFEPRPSQELTNRRICIHDSDVLGFLSSRPNGPRVRSFVSFSKTEVNSPPESGAVIPSAFKLLRLLDVKPIRFTTIHSDMFQLLHLKYMVLSLSMEVLPPAFVKLWNLQTLVVSTTSPTLEIQADIWKLSRLRHFKTNASATLPKKGKTSKKCQQLQTLGAISPESCTDQFIERTPSLKKLAILGRLSLLLESHTGIFEYRFDKFRYLENLKLVNVVLDERNQLRLPKPSHFPPKLRSLTLADTCLDWGEISTLGELQNLEVLKLKNKAFMGLKWVVADGGFSRLQVLHIKDTDLAVWEASAHHFPRLQNLRLWNCEKLQEVPKGLADIPSLQTLDLYNTKLAAASAHRIQEAKKILKDEGIISGEFQLLINDHSN